MFHNCGLRVPLSGLATALSLFLFPGGSAHAAAPLFPQSLHLTRVVDAPSGGQQTVVEEYYFGSKVVSVVGQHTVIADYEKHEITDIDRAASTYSVTSFEDVAQSTSATQAGVRATKAAAPEAWPLRSASRRGSVARAEYFESEPVTKSELKKVEVGVDSSVRLSRDALEVMVGAAYPRSRTDAAEIVIRAAGSHAGAGASRVASDATGGAETYALPVDQTVTYDLNGKSTELRNRVTRIANELPPADVLAIPNGAKLVESAAVQTRHVLEQLDAKPAPANNRKAKP